MVFSVGSLNMTTEPVKNFLEGLAVRKKAKYASLLHDRARVKFVHTHHTYTQIHTYTYIHFIVI